MTRRHNSPDHYTPVVTLHQTTEFANYLRKLMRMQWESAYLPREPAKKRNEFSGAMRLDPYNTGTYLRNLDILFRRDLRILRICNGASSKYYKKMHNRAIRAIIRSRKPFKHYGGI